MNDKLKIKEIENVSFSGIESEIITERDPEQEEIARLMGVKF